MHLRGTAANAGLCRSGDQCHARFFILLPLRRVHLALLQHDSSLWLTSQRTCSKREPVHSATPACMPQQLKKVCSRHSVSSAMQHRLQYNLVMS